MRQRAEEFAEKACRLAHALPDAAVIDGDSYEGESCLAELRKVRRLQCLPLLPLAALRGKAGGYGTHVVQDSPGIHRCKLLSVLCPLYL
jgi:hypothetical protein